MDGGTMLHRPIKTAVITGPTGTIGHALVDNLLRKGIDVYAVIRPGSGRAATLYDFCRNRSSCCKERSAERDNEKENVNHDGAVGQAGTVVNANHTAKLRIIPCDASQYAALPSLIPSGADAFFHLAWAKTVGGGRNDMPAQISNIRYTIDAARAASALGCRVFVGAGSQAEYGRVEGVLRSDTACFPENGYGMAKLCAGEMTRVECETLGMDHIWMRVLSIYGPYDGEKAMIPSVIRTLLRGERPALTAGEQLWDYLYSKDVAEGFVRAAESGISGKVYPLGSGTARPLREYVELLRDAVDPTLPLGFGVIPYAPKQVMHLEADISELEKDTEFKPRYTFPEGIRETVEWTRNNPV